MPAGIRHALERAVHDARAAFDRQVARAEQIVERAEDEHYRAINASATKIAELQSQLETFEGLEHERFARETRTELAQLDTNHREVVASANKKLEQAYVDYLRSIQSAAVGMECSFNGARARITSTPNEN
ncbi:MAG TPA: hypothetical protein V6C81_29280 [Planktothrix sp.]|jgi:hypothetical protein